MHGLGLFDTRYLIDASNLHQTLIFIIIIHFFWNIFHPTLFLGQGFHSALVGSPVCRAGRAEAWAPGEGRGGGLGADAAEGWMCLMLFEII